MIDNDLALEFLDCIIKRYGGGYIVPDPIEIILNQVKKEIELSNIHEYIRYTKEKYE